MNQAKFFVMLFLVVFLTTVLTNSASATGTYHGIVWGITEDTESPSSPGQVRSYTQYYPSNWGNYGYLDLDYAYVAAQSWSSVGGSLIDSDGSICGNPFTGGTCNNSGSIWVDAPPRPGGFLVAEHAYDAWNGDSNWPVFYTAYQGPLGGTLYYFLGG